MSTPSDRPIDGNFRGRFVGTKIIATLGPASSEREVLARMFDAGLDVCRLNFSHGTHADHERTLTLVRALAEERDQSICVIGDLCGPKIRLGPVPGDGIVLCTGQSVRVVGGDAPSTVETLHVSYERLAEEVAPGQRVLINDGLVRLVARERDRDALICECTAGGRLASRKGVNLPDSKLSVPALTEKDRDDLAWALAHDIDYIALSFVRQPDDLYMLKRAIKAAGVRTPVIIKIEKPEALEHLDELIAETDAVLVARGDLGVETDLWRVPLVQKDLVARCQRAGVPVIVATQMLESMIGNPIPTRAEVSDVANAILDRADAVMLSGETAVGQYPVEAVEAMNQIAAATGEFVASLASGLSVPPAPAPAAQLAALPTGPTSAIAHAAVQAARDLRARLVAVWTATGATVRRVAAHRLPMPVVGLTYDERVFRQLDLLFGVIPLRVPPFDNPAETAGALDGLLVSRDLAAAGDTVVVVTSTRPTTPGATDTVLVRRIGETRPAA